MRYFHNSYAAALALTAREIPQAHGHKPSGLWFDVDGDWIRWCRENEPDWIGAHYFEFKFPPSIRLCRVGSVAALDEFTSFYGLPFEGEQLVVSPDVWNIDWRRLAKDFDGVVVAPYFWARRLDGRARWYYTWDCASGCIWRRQNEIQVDRVAPEEVHALLEPDGVS